VYFFFSFQSPARALKVEAGKENPNLTDNWDDAEGYYSKMTFYIFVYMHVSCAGFQPRFEKWASTLCYRVCSNEQLFIHTVSAQHEMPGHPSGYM